MLNSPYQVYQQSSVQTATPGQLIIMLYEGAIRFTKGGIEGIKKQNYEMANTNLKKAQAVINELLASLNYDFEVSKNLSQIYEYLLHLLIEANLKKNDAFAQEALGYLQEFRDTWKQAMKASAGQTQTAAGPM
ncbi:flagellar export chaperone FliS [Paenibacillus sp. BIHB 4019]|uniref:Flagellar secretion chaperone FliS n=1 Tax=Paenibacillus sp. BIHB 4019 TaxID=1870819 RepID=A0A1B2DGX6_9BACL|nr:flagellar export chaperone FliS [Paenibacillus sp. BIHB 4019]ANY66968.1 flagellar export chaperone FliS [Paenibacillus sp. BIHB 4019]